MGTPRQDRRYALTAAALVALASAVHVLYAGLLPLSPQEAYYWQWARHPALGYFDHPPMAAWLIAGVVRLFGDSERAIRASALLCSLAFALFFWLSAKRLFGARAALVATAAALCTPLFALGQVVITPDAPLVAAWMAAFYFTVVALQDDRPAWLLPAGTAVGLALLSKFTALLLFPQILAALLLDARGRRMLRTAWPYVACVLAVAIYFPNLWWNAHHGWITWGFQVNWRAHQTAPPSGRRLGSFLGLQSLSLSPLVFLAALWALYVSVRRWREPALRLCAIFGLPLVAIALLLSPFMWVKANWVDVAWPTALLAGVGLWLERERALRPFAVAALGLALVATLYVHVAPLWPALPFPARQDPTAGWKELAARVDAEREKLGPNAFVLGCHYKPASELAYYLPGRPEVFAVNSLGEEGLAFDFWSRADQLLGREGLLVLDQREYKWCTKKEQFCSALHELDPLVVKRAGHVVTTFKLWRCHYVSLHASRVRAPPVAGPSPAPPMVGAR